MGNPQNFSLDIPRRCQMLIDDLWPQVSKKPECGTLPLNASFLLAISTPMVNLPIERIWKPQGGRAVGHLNDAAIDTQLARAICRDIGTNAVASASFYSADAWRYQYLPEDGELPNLSEHGLPPAVEATLATKSASQAAASLSAKTFCLALRNSLAHGGIIYLDQDGRTTSSAPVRMYCFVSTKLARGNVVEGLHFLRVSMKDYREFLKLWTNWLQTEATKIAAK